MRRMAVFRGIVEERVSSNEMLANNRSLHRSENCREEIASNCTAEQLCCALRSSVSTALRITHGRLCDVRSSLSPLPVIGHRSPLVNSP
mmetsp:Transcript_35963/g.67089  ORF Transcript_35963/g.67089 Transcript_35963/m.67089 type:complete len:89 (+) Transcript_35963:3452-3718(+)